MMLWIGAVALAVATEPLVCDDDLRIDGVPDAYVDIYGAVSGNKRLIRSLQGDLSLYLAGDPDADERIEARVATRLHIAEAALTRIRYSDGGAERWTFVAIDPVRPSRLRSAPEGPAPPDPGGLIATWQEYEATGWRLQRSGAARPVPECGALHCLFGFEHPELAPYKATFDAGVPGTEQALSEVLLRDPDTERRAAAAFLLGHGTDAALVSALLLRALDDPASKVRNNALRVLGHITRNHPDVPVAIGPFIDALHLPTVTDRNKALVLLASLAGRDPAVATEIVDRASDVLMSSLELAQPNNRDPARDILAAASGLDYGACETAAWERWIRAREVD